MMSFLAAPALWLMRKRREQLEAALQWHMGGFLTLPNVETGESVVLSTDIAKEDPSIASLTGVFGGADWHEREAAEMMGIEFVGHPNLTHLYLPDAFEGHPLRKTFSLLSRDVKPWPGTVDVEPMPDEEGPSTENPEDAG